MTASSHPRCPACDAASTARAMAYVARPRVEDALFAGLELIACERCLTHFAHPMPSPAALADYYRAAYRADGRNSSAPAGFPADNLWYLSRALAVAALARDALAGAGDAAADPLRVVDVGAGYGHSLFALRRALGRPLRATAIEPDSRCHPSLGLVADDIVAEPAATALARMPRSSVDLALLLHLLEHVADPHAFLASIDPLLSPTAVVIIEVPHCPPHRVRWYNPETPHVPHLVFFSEAGLGWLLSRVGWTVDRLASVGPAFNADGSHEHAFQAAPIDPGDALARGALPQVPYPVFERTGGNRLFLRAVARSRVAAVAAGSSKEPIR